MTTALMVVGGVVLGAVLGLAGVFVSLSFAEDHLLPL